MPQAVYKYFPIPILSIKSDDVGYDLQDLLFFRKCQNFCIQIRILFFMLALLIHTWGRFMILFMGYYLTKNHNEWDEQFVIGKRK